ncbi:unnamed protein product [Absidia cylindrospora]
MAEPRLLCRAKALYPYTAKDTSSLTFERGDIIDVLCQLPSGWWDGLLRNGVRGWFPSNYVQIVELYTHDIPGSSYSSPSFPPGATMPFGDFDAHRQNDSDSYQTPTLQNTNTARLFDDQVGSNSSFTHGNNRAERIHDEFLPAISNGKSTMVLLPI